MNWHIEEKEPRLVLVTIQFQARQGKGPEFRMTAEGFVEQVRREQGNVACECYAGARGKLAYQMVMTWRSRADYEHHRQSPHTKLFFSELAAALLAREPRVTIWEAEAEDGG
jgi:quinol monooxygenase YgiN